MREPCGAGLPVVSRGSVVTVHLRCFGLGQVGRPGARGGSAGCPGHADRDGRARTPRRPGRSSGQSTCAGRPPRGRPAASGHIARRSVRRASRAAVCAGLPRVRAARPERAGPPAGPGMADITAPAAEKPPLNRSDQVLRCGNMNRPGGVPGCAAASAAARPPAVSSLPRSEFRGCAVRIAIAQTDARLGDVRSNLNEARQRIAEAAEDGADLVVFPELSLHGYALGSVAEDTSVAAGDPRLAALSEAGPDVLVGVYERAGLRHHNTSVYASGGRVVHVQRKLYLPNYLMWEERKHFYPGQRLNAFDTSHGRMASLICNDAWQPMLPWLAAQDGAEVLLVTANSAAVSDESTVDNFSYWRE